MTSRDDFLRSYTNAREEKLRAFYERIEAEMAARKGKALGFSVGIPDGVTSDLVDTAIEYYRKQGWTVNRSQQKTDHYLDFA